jgi:endonuclease/exonuclease/phosphatase family metal-dependent hydrolase
VQDLRSTDHLQSAGDVKLRIVTWNLNTWLNRRDKNISNSQLWNWADKHLSPDVVIFTEAQTPPPRDIIQGRWSTAHRPFGFPGVSKWGTVIAARHSSEVRVEHITTLGTDHELDSQFPGTFTAADLIVKDRNVATIVGLHLRYRKDKTGTFIGDPEDDLKALKKDLVPLFADRQKPMIIGGDFNYVMGKTPSVLKRLCRGKLSLIDPFEDQPIQTFEQDWEDRNRFCLDYFFVSKNLNERVTHKQGGFADFPTSLEMSDHAPLLLELDVSEL